ncbi:MULTISPECIES: hypothetical protein [Bradyrhizobium]|uniref:hypothetical protein n=1 Tax=Bradyrhizobium TaxID=374 RepID=UPI0004BBA3FF|nr:hypothetical protein [Bradyrhizobium elkanii]MBP2434026.1 hypothetical protein [Bradyrhizobium elkanii]WLA85762.1 hypothetical protein QNJ99_17030 [Bradyrhizobium elkanii]WLA89036.1 hypothetical protein QNJ96_28600 [Bradyrhizobium elkanii]
MESTVIAEFHTRRAAELAVEHVVQECRVPGGDVFVQPAGAAKSTGDRRAGADAKAAPMPKQGGMLKGPIEASVDFHEGDLMRVADALKGAGAKLVRTN